MTALDAIGFNLATPEPSLFWPVTLGGIGFLGYRRRANRISRPRG